jgi:hypothetical protein
MVNLIFVLAPLLLNAVEEYGQDWERVAQETQSSSLDCQNTFQHLVKQVKKEETISKKELNRTGILLTDIKKVSFLLNLG